MQTFIPLLLLSLSASLDTFLIIAFYSMSRVRIPFSSKAVITVITTLGTYLSLEFGKLCSVFLPNKSANLIGNVLLILIGLWFIWDFIRKKDGMPTANGDVKTLGMKQTIILSLAMTLNNIGTGIAAGIADISALYATAYTFVVTMLCIALGIWAGRGILSKIMGQYASLISGLFLIILGVYQTIL